MCLLHKNESENKPIKYGRNELQKQTDESEEMRRMKNSTFERAMRNNKSRQVNEVEFILRLAKLCAPREKKTEM